jgi:ABC-2 type transport system permease protein
MMNVLYWEFFKLFRQKSTYYGLVAFLIIEAFVLITAYYQGRYILETLLSTLQESFIFEGDLLNGNLVIYIILNSLWFHVPLILIILISGMVSAEYKDGTIQTILLQGVPKRRFITAKYVSAFLFTLLILFILAVSTMGVSYLLFGQGDLIVYFDSLNIFPPAEARERIIGAFLAGTNSMIFYTSVSITLAIIFKEPARVWILAGLFLVLVNLLAKIDFGTFLNQWLFVKQIDTWQYFFFYEPDVSAILKKSSTLLLYSIVIAIIGIRIFETREIE